MHTSNGIASAVNDEAGSNSVDGVSEEVANEVAIESEDDEATENECETAGTNEEENEISMNKVPQQIEGTSAEQAESHLCLEWIT